MVGVATLTQTRKRVITDFSEKNVTFMAAGIAYNAFISLAPLLLLVLFLTAVFGATPRGKPAASVAGPAVTGRPARRHWTATSSPST